MYIENSLRLEGNQSEIERFVLQAKCMCEHEEAFEDNSDFHFAKFIPTPKNLLDFEDWRLAHWGIMHEIETLYDKSKKTYYFDVDFDYNVELLLRGFLIISKQFPNVRFIHESYKVDIQDADLALHRRTKFINGAIELEEQYKVRVKRCSHCNRPGSYERVSRKERTNGKYL